jgi:hypothetical protein
MSSPNIVTYKKRKEDEVIDEVIEEGEGSFKVI